MPRPPRTIVTDYPHHVIHRGHNRQSIFDSPRDYRFLLDHLKLESARQSIDILSYCLMTNHVHLVLVPRREASDLSRLIKKVAGTYTRYVNARTDRTGTLWEGRFRSSVIDTNRYLLACCRYIDLNPEKKKIVAHPGHYEWSSYRELAGLHSTGIVQKSIIYELLGMEGSSPSISYRRYVEQGVDDRELSIIRRAAQRNQLTGDSEFVDCISSHTGRRIEHRGRGRPVTQA